MTMWSGARVIAIDDNKDDLNGIVTALQNRGIGVLPFHFRGESSLKRCARGVRLIFADINISPSAASPYQQHQAVAAALSALLNERNGPWVLVAWTASPDQVNDLLAVLRDSLGTSRLPIAGLGIDKSVHMRPTGRYDTRRIVQSISRTVAADPVARAMLDLELRAEDAAHDITTTISELAASSAAADIAQVFVELSKAINPTAPHSAERVFQTLGPAFQDRLVKRGISAAERRIWNEAFAASSGDPLANDRRARLNTSLHLDTTAKKADRGAITLIPTEKKEVLESVLGDSLQSVIFSDFIVRDKAVKELRNLHQKNQPKAAQFEEAAKLTEFCSALKWALVELVPACDVANNKRGLRRAALALLIPDTMNFKVCGNHAYELPMLQLNKENVQIVVTSRITFSPVPRRLRDLPPHARIRDQLIDTISQHIAASQSRLGLVTF